MRQLGCKIKVALTPWDSILLLHNVESDCHLKFGFLGATFCHLVPVPAPNVFSPMEQMISILLNSMNIFKFFNPLSCPLYVSDTP